MLFSSTVFVYLFLPCVILIYYLLKKWRFLQNVFLLIASLIFYAWGEPKFVVVLIASIVMNWGLGYVIERCRRKRILIKWILIIDICLNISLLFVFKYLSFAGHLFQGITGIKTGIPKIALPIGISFFTFQAMSYVIDVYRQKAEVQKNLLYVGLYISFFPQLIAGPIVRYETIANEIKNRKETVDDFFDGFARFVVGLSKKVLLANGFAVLADQVFGAVQSGRAISVLFGWLGAVAYSLQIFFDFSGYSDMAIGMGRMFGFHFGENFDYPYISTSITEFWRRWHISLGSWFRDYVYIPLGGSRCSRRRTVFNLLIVWSLTGIWHGANLTFLVWGLMFFVLLTVEKVTGLSKPVKGIRCVLMWLYQAFFVVIGWVVFRSDSLHEAYVHIKIMFGLSGSGLCDGAFSGWLSQNSVLFIVGILLCTPVFKLLFERTKEMLFFKLIRPVVLCVLFVLCMASIVSNSYNPFIYFNF